MKKNIKVNSIVMLFFFNLVFFLCLSSFSQEAKDTSEKPIIDADTKIQIVEKIGELLVNNYAYPEKAKEMKNLITNKLKKGDYNSIDNVRKFAGILTQDLRKIKNDLHLRVSYSPGSVRRIRKSRSQSDEERKKALEEKIERERKSNFGFKELKLLEGNIGYLNLGYFSSLRQAGEICVAAINFLANAEAVILDLRSNNGGSHFMLKLISSYFIENNTNLWSFEWKEGGRQQIEQHWVLPFVPGRTLFEKDLYILTSGSTFSAAEGFSYNMKAHKRATLIGETTQGGGIAGNLEIVNNDFVIFVPKYRSINPITNTYIDIEGNGVKPDIEVPAHRALFTAHMHAIDKLIEKSNNLKNTNSLNWIRDWVKTKQDPYKLDFKSIKKYVGKYTKDFEIFIENGSLYLRESSSYIEYPGFSSKLIPMSENLFIIEKAGFVRIKFETDNHYNIKATLLYQNGNKVTAEKYKKE
ncbi:MAG: hypothetical protein GTO16_00960 [Candidatus Aminicenantes bacterium]|nr:hypothetical protein [Candidatus Aminicenantes bacterium]